MTSPTSLPSVPPEVMPTADSLADAETVMRFCEEVRLGDPIAPRALRLMRRAIRAYINLRIPDFQSAEDRQ